MRHHSSELGDELQALKSDIAKLLGSAGESILDASRGRAETLAHQIKAALSDLGEALGQEEECIENLIADRPVTTLASAFALGVAVGYMLRKS